MILNEDMKKRFCRDYAISIQVFEEPYFTQRIKLFGLESEYTKFVEMIENCFDGNFELYMQEYNATKERIMEYIKNSDAYIHLNLEDMQNFAIAKNNFREGDVYKQTNVGKKFISIDIEKANFSSLVYYAKTHGLNFFDEYDYQKFVGKFTLNNHFIKSKYIRQVVFGNCNPKKQTTYEKYLIFNLLQHILKETKINNELVRCLCHDEIVIDASDLSEEKINQIRNIVIEENKVGFPLHYELFKLGRVLGTDGYVKKIEDNIVDEQPKDVYKCLNAMELVFLYRKIKNEQVLEDDLVIVHDKILAKLLFPIDIDISFEEKKGKA